MTFLNWVIDFTGVLHDVANPRVFSSFRLRPILASAVHDVSWANARMHSHWLNQPEGGDDMDGAMNKASGEFHDSSEERFMTGLFTGALIGAGLALLFAPRAGSELRRQIADSASIAGRTITDRYQQVSRHVSDTADEISRRGKQMYKRARSAASQVGAEAERMATDVAEIATKPFVIGGNAGATSGATESRSLS